MDELLRFIPSMVVIIALGWFLKRISFLKKEDVGVINKIIVYVALPALIFLAVHQAALSIGVMRLPVFALVVMTLCVGMAFLVGKLSKLESPLLGGFLLVAALGNTGYLGFPLTIGLYGQENLVKSIFYDFGTVVFLFTVGVIIAENLGTEAKEGNRVREFLLFPSTVALFAGLILHFIPLPPFLTGSLEYLSQATIALVMLTIGLTLEGKNIRRYIWPLIFVVLIKLVASPLIALIIAKVLGFNPTDTGILVLEASMPAVMLSLVVGLKYELEVEFISMAILVTILASLVTIPLCQAMIKLV